MFSITSGDSVFVQFFYKNRLITANELSPEVQFILSGQITDKLAALLFDLFGNLVGQAFSSCTMAHRVFKRMNVTESDVPDQYACFFKILIGFARKTHH